jgi:hypothetical protein
LAGLFLGQLLFLSGIAAYRRAVATNVHVGIADTTFNSRVEKGLGKTEMIRILFTMDTTVANTIHFSKVKTLTDLKTIKFLRKGMTDVCAGIVDTAVFIIGTTPETEDKGQRIKCETFRVF